MADNKSQGSSNKYPGYEWGIYENKIPYLIREKGEPSVIIFEPSRELLKNVTHRVDETIKLYNMILPPDCSICVLGYDPNLPTEHTQEQIAAANAKFIKEKYRPGIVMGVSYGGFISIPFAAMYPELVQKMVLMVSAYMPSKKGTLLMKEFMEIINGEHHYAAAKKFNSLIFSKILKMISIFLTWKRRKSLMTNINPSSTLINAYAQILKSGEANKKYLTEIKAPTLVIGGDMDQFFSQELFAETAKLIPNGRVEIFKNQGHYVPIEKIKQVKKVFAEFINEG